MRKTRIIRRRTHPGPAAGLRVDCAEPILVLKIFTSGCRGTFAIKGVGLENRNGTDNVSKLLSAARDGSREALGQVLDAFRDYLLAIAGR